MRDANGGTRDLRLHRAESGVLKVDLMNTSAFRAANRSEKVLQILNAKRHIEKLSRSYIAYENVRNSIHLGRSCILL